MTGLEWTWEYFLEWIDMCRDSLKNPNPLIEQILKTCPGSYIFGMGGHSVVLCIPPNIVAKVSLRPGGEHVRNEQHVLDLLAQSNQPRPHIVEHFYSGVDVSFFELLDCGHLHDRLLVKGPRPILQWMLQLASAAACLEAIGYAHGDINPLNVLFDRYDRAKLIDFDHSLKIGEGLDVGYEPYVRQKRIPEVGQYGVAGPVTEQFALGAVFWYMSRGTELYAELEGVDMVDRLIDEEFPATDPEDPIDRIIGKCLQRSYASIADLVQETKDAETMSSEKKAQMTSLCEGYYRQLTPAPKEATKSLEEKESSSIVHGT